MKKNNMLRIASVLLVAVLLSTCAIAGVFANYQTVGGAEDSARIAKWGVKITATGVMFNDTYKDEATTYSPNEKVGEITVQADTKGTDIIAPGTKGTLASIAVTGKPEVDVNVTYEADLTLKGWEVLDATNTKVYYCPIVIKVGSEKIDGTAFTSAGAFETAVETAIANAKATYHTNTDLSCVNDDLQVSWEWAYDEDTVKDTALGDAAAENKAATITLKVTTTITQAD